MKTIFRNSYENNKVYKQVAEYKMKELKRLLIKLPAVVLLISSYILIDVSPPAATWLFLGGLIGLHAIN